MKLLMDKEMLIYAFRYALKRSTYSTHTVANEIMNHKNQISIEDLNLFIREIFNEINLGFMSDIDKRTWETLLYNLEDLLMEKVKAKKGGKS